MRGTEKGQKAAAENKFLQQYTCEEGAQAEAEEEMRHREGGIMRWNQCPQGDMSDVKAGESRDEDSMLKYSLKYLTDVLVSKKAVIPDFRVPRPPQKRAQIRKASPHLSSFIVTINYFATETAFSSYHM